METQEILRQANIPEDWWENCYITEDGEICTPVFSEEGELILTGEESYQKIISQPETPPAPTENPVEKAVITLARMQAKALSDTDALEVTALFPVWEAGTAYQEGDRFTYEDNFYKVLQDHTSEEQWKPGEAPSLYVSASDPAVEWPEWREPTGAHDAYNTGDKVTYNGKRYVSKIDGNTTVPGTDGRYWEEQKEE
jgi:chitodextrinase